MPDEPELRRVDDARISGLHKKVADVERKVDSVDRAVRDIRDMLFNEPDASPLGRQLLHRAIENRTDIDKLDGRLDVVEKTIYQAVGVQRFIVIIATVLGAVGAFFGTASYFLGHHA